MRKAFMGECSSLPPAGVQVDQLTNIKKFFRLLWADPKTRKEKNAKAKFGQNAESVPSDSFLLSHRFYDLARFGMGANDDKSPNFSDR